MDRGAVSGPPRRDKALRKRKKRSPGLRVEARDGFWHVRGTARAAGRSKRVRESTGLAAIAENWDAAEARRIELERSFRDHIILGIKPSLPLIVAVDKYLTGKPELKQGDKRKLREVARAFGHRVMNEIADEEWIAFVDQRHAGNKPETRERYLNTVIGFLNWCLKKPRRWISELPSFERDQSARKPKHRRARRVAELTPQLVLFLVDHAAPHLKGQIAAEWSTGARVSSVLYGCRLCDYIAAPGREQLTFHDTKSGEPVVAAMHPRAAALMRDYLEWRGDLHDREGPLFLTPRRDRSGKRLPYADNGKEGGGQNKTAFKAMKRRAAAEARRRGAQRARTLRSAGRRDEGRQAIEEAKAVASLLLQVTQHWFRHNIATSIMANGGSLRDAMDQAGWLTAESVMAYSHDVPERHREVINLLGASDAVGTSLTRDAGTDEKTA